MPHRETTQGCRASLVVARRCGCETIHIGTLTIGLHIGSPHRRQQMPRVLRKAANKSDDSIRMCSLKIPLGSDSTCSDVIVYKQLFCNGGNRWLAWLTVHSDGVSVVPPYRAARNSSAASSAACFGRFPPPILAKAIP